MSVPEPPLDTDGLLALLENWGISCQLVRHDPVLTVAQSAALDVALPQGARCKNLLLRDKKGRLFMVLAPADAGPVDLTALRSLLGSARLSFAPHQTLGDMLGLPPGATSPLALVNDRECAITLVVDTALDAEDTFLLHPLTNAATVAITREGLEEFLRRVGAVPLRVPVPLRPTSD